LKKESYHGIDWNGHCKFAIERKTLFYICFSFTKSNGKADISLYSYNSQSVREDQKWKRPESTAIGKLRLDMLHIIEEQNSDFPFLEKISPLFNNSREIVGVATVVLGYVGRDRIKKNAKNLHFGHPLRESLQLAKAQGIEHVTKMAIRCLRNQGLNTVGLFRLTGTRGTVKLLRKQIDAGEEVSLEFETSHDNAALLKVEKLFWYFMYLFF